MSLMSRGMDFVAERGATAAGVSVTYAPAAGGSYTVTAVPADPVEEVGSTNPPARAEHRRRDYLITVAAWTAAGLSGEPAKGDRITQTINSVAKVFEVVPLTGEKAWRYSDPERTTFRIHTRPQG